MQSPWASHNGNMDQQQSAPAWPDHFDFGDASTHFDVAQWTDPAAGDAAFHNFDAPGVTGQALFQPDQHHHQPLQQQQQQQQQHLQQPGYAPGHDSQAGLPSGLPSGGFDVYDGSKFSFGPGHGPGGHQGPQGFNNLNDFVRHDGPPFGQMPDQYPMPPQPHHGQVYGDGHMQQQQQQPPQLQHQHQQQPPQLQKQQQPQAGVPRQSQPVPLAPRPEAAVNGGTLGHAQALQSGPPQAAPTRRQTRNSQNVHYVAPPGQHVMGQYSAPPQQHQQQQPHQPQQHPQQQQHQFAIPPASQPAPGGYSSAAPGFPQIQNLPVGTIGAHTPTTKTASPRPSVEALGEPASKRRKKAVGKTADGSIESTPERSDSPVIAVAPQKVVTDDVDSLAAPEPTVEDGELVNLAKKRAIPRFSIVSGLPHLVATSTVKLSTPKSHDKLLPVVAHPSRSGKAMVPELGADLPCEVQGRFSAAYRPDPTVSGGLDFRRTEAAAHLQKFEQDMAKLGRRRPRYTEYPQLFKEQIKSDETVKSKAERKAKKEKEVQPTRPDVRPDDPIEAASWDILGAVTFDATSSRTPKAIGEAVVQVRDILTTLRSKLTQAKQEYDQLTKDGKDAKEIAAAKKQYDVRHEALYKALDVIIEHGEDAILENLGGHPRLVLTLVNILISCINSGEVNGKISKATLELMTHFSMTKQVAHQANFHSVQKRLADKGDAETRDLLKDVVAAVKDTGDSAKDKDSKPTTAKATPAASSSTSSKRARVEDEAETRTVKKVAVESGNSLSRKMGPQKFALNSASKAPKAGTVTTYSSKARPISKPAPKVDSVVPEGNELVRLVNARPDTSRMMTRLEATKAQANSSRSATTSSSGSSGGIASLLDMINAPKPDRPPPRVLKAIEAPESPEEKAKRIRKEARRRLRVTWRPDEELEQVRIFHQDAHELEGRSANMTLDAADGRREGMLLKQRKDQLEEDDDEDSDSEVSARPWLTPVLTATSGIPEKARTKNYITRGGSIIVETEEQRIMAEREQRQLMAIYTDAADIPPTPKSPQPEPAPFIDAKVASLPQSFTEIHRRWDTVAKVGAKSALYYAKQRLEAVKPAKSGPAASLPMVSTSAPLRTAKSTAPFVLPAGTMEEQVLFLLTHEKVKSWTDLDPFSKSTNNTPEAEVSKAIADIMALVKLLAGKPFPPIQPPDWLAEFDKIQEWWTGYHQDMQKAKGVEEVPRPQPNVYPQPPQWGSFFPPPPPMPQSQTSPSYSSTSPSYSQTLPSYSSTSPSYSSTSPSYSQPPPLASYLPPGHGYTPTDAPASYVPPPRSGPQDIAAIFAQLTQANSVPQRPQLPPPPGYMHLNPNDNSMQQTTMLQQQQMQPSVQEAMDWEPERRDRDRDHRDRDRGDRERDRDRSWTDRGDWERDGWDQKRGGTTKKVTLPPHRPVNAALIGTKPCTFWRQGKCARGDSCTFRHD